MFLKKHFSNVMCMYFSYMNNDVISDVINVLFYSENAHFYKVFEYFLYLLFLNRAD